MKREDKKKAELWQIFFFFHKEKGERQREVTGRTKENDWDDNCQEKREWLRHRQISDIYTVEASNIYNALRGIVPLAKFKT